MINKLKIQQATALVGLALVAQNSLAVQALGRPLGLELGSVLGGELGDALPIGLGGVAALTALSLVIGIQLVKRNKK